jgi:hypothetical protein
MDAGAQEKLISDYLSDLRRAARGVPRRRRRELISEIEEHIREAVGAGASEAETRNALERLGEPEQIVAAERERLGPPARGGAIEWLAVVLLLAGGFLAGVGWLVGLVMLWSSRFWTLRDKLIGTFLVPGGLFGALIFLSTRVGGAQLCTSGGGPGRPTVTRCVPQHAPLASLLVTAVAIVLVVAPVFTAFYLGRRIRRPVATV